MIPVEAGVTDTILVILAVFGPFVGAAATVSAITIARCACLDEPIVTPAPVAQKSPHAHAPIAQPSYPSPDHPRPQLPHRARRNGRRVAVWARVIHPHPVERPRRTA